MIKILIKSTVVNQKFKLYEKFIYEKPTMRRQLKFEIISMLIQTRTKQYMIKNNKTKINMKKNMKRTPSWKESLGAKIAQIKWFMQMFN